MGRSSRPEPTRGRISYLLDGDPYAQRLAQTPAVGALATRVVAAVDAQGISIDADDVACMVAAHLCEVATKSRMRPDVLVTQIDDAMVNQLVDTIVNTMHDDGRVFEDDERDVAVPLAVLGGLLSDLAMAARVGATALARGDNTCTLTNLAADAILRLTRPFDEADDGISGTVSVPDGALRMTRGALSMATYDLDVPGTLPLAGTEDELEELAGVLQRVFNERITYINELLGH